MSAEEKKATPETPVEKPPGKDQKLSSSKPRLRGAFKFKTWEEKERWEKIGRDAGLL